MEFVIMFFLVPFSFNNVAHLIFQALQLFIIIINFIIFNNIIINFIFIIIINFILIYSIYFQ